MNISLWNAEWNRIAEVIEEGTYLRYKGSYISQDSQMFDSFIAKRTEAKSSNSVFYDSMIPIWCLGNHVLLVFPGT